MKIAKELNVRAPVSLLMTGRCRASVLTHRLARNRGRLQSKACLVTAAGLLAVFILTGWGLNAALPGLAAGKGLLRDNPFMARMSSKEEERYTRTLAGLLRDDPRTFLRLVEADVKLLLDEPGLRRADGPMTIWQYRTESCVLDAYLTVEEHKNNINNTLRVVDYEVRPRVKAGLAQTLAAVTADDDVSCFTSVLAAAPSQRPVVLASLF